MNRLAVFCLYHRNPSVVPEQTVAAVNSVDFLLLYYKYAKTAIHSLFSLSGSKNEPDQESAHFYCLFVMVSFSAEGPALSPTQGFGRDRKLEISIGIWFFSKGKMPPFAVYGLKAVTDHGVLQKLAVLVLLIGNQTALRV